MVCVLLLVYILNLMNVFKNHNITGNDNRNIVGNYTKEFLLRYDTSLAYFISNVRKESVSNR